MLARYADELLAQAEDSLIVHSPPEPKGGRLVELEEEAPEDSSGVVAQEMYMAAEKGSLLHSKNASMVASTSGLEAATEGPSQALFSRHRHVQK